MGRLSVAPLGPGTGAEEAEREPGHRVCERGAEAEGRSIVPKMKTNRSAAKRFKRTSRGKYRRQRAYRSHILTKKRRKRKRKLRKPALVSQADKKRVRRLLAGGG